MKVRGFWQRKWRWKRVTKLLARDGFGCWICDNPLDRTIRDENHREYITFDHIIPRSRGGSDKLENLRLTHQVCNNARGNDPIAPRDEVEHGT